MSENVYYPVQAIYQVMLGMTWKDYCREDYISREITRKNLGTMVHTLNTGTENVRCRLEDWNKSKSMLHNQIIDLT